VRTLRTVEALAILTCACATAALIAAPQKTSREDSDHLRDKIAAIVANAAAARPTARRTSVLEREVNAYLIYELKDEIPVGVVEPIVTIVGEGRIAGRAIVDLDAVRKSQKRGLFDPMNLLTGRLPVSAAGTLTTADGVGHFALESADISGVPVPKRVLQELVSYYSRSPERPDGIGLDDPFELPAAIRQIDVGKGQAIVVQ
jgi:hypothetical protein